MAKIWRAREASVKIDHASDVTITDLAALDSFFSSAVVLEGSLKEFTITPPEPSVEQIDLVGEDANGFQNADKDKKPLGMATLAGKLIVRGDEDIEPFLYSSSTAVAGTHTRYQPKDYVEISILANFDDGTYERSVVLDNADVTKLGDLSMTADGYWERDFEVTCLARDFHEEVKD